MILEHLPDGRTLADTQVIAALTARPAAAVRRWCVREPQGYDVEASSGVLAGVPDPVLLCAADAQRYLGIPSGTVYSWAHRGVLMPLDELDGRQLYDITDLLTLRDGS